MKRKLQNLLLILVFIGLWQGYLAAQQIQDMESETKNGTLRTVNNDETIIYGTMQDKNYPLLSFPVKNGDAVFSEVSYGFKLSGAVYLDRTLYGSRWETGYNAPDKFFSVYEADSWLRVKDIQASNDLDKIQQITFDYETGNMYALSDGTDYNFEDAVYRTLATVNTETGKIRPIGDLAETMAAIACHKDGQLYGISRTNNLYKINKHTAEITLIGETGITRYKSCVSGAVFDNTNNKLYWSLRLADNTSGLYEINLSTGAATLVVNYPNYEEITAIFIREYDPQNGTPAKGSDIIITPTVDADLTATVSVKAPTQTINGNTLSGTLSGKIIVGGVTTFDIPSIDPGQTYTTSSFTVPAGGARLLSAVFSNSEGKGTYARTQFWFGEDTPGEVSDLQVAKNATGKPEVTWTPLTKGVHGGYIDVSNLKYKIVRYPDSVLLDAAYTGTQYVDISAISDLNFYSYSVTPHIGTSTGDEVISNDILLGDSYTIPYENIFSENSVRLWTIADVDKDSYTWDYDSYYDAVTVGTNYAMTNDDWLISPPISLEGGTAYELEYDYTSRYRNNIGSMKVFYGRSATPEGQAILLKDHPTVQSPTFLNEKITIIIPKGEDGDYYIGFYSYCSDYGSLKIKSVKMRELAKANTPAAVDNLLITPAKNGVLSATVTFHIPSKDITGFTLADPVTSVSIYKNDEATPVKILIGTELVVPSWTDTNPVNGYNTYRIIAENAKGEGLSAVSTIFIGEDTPAAVGDPVLAKNEGKALVTWTAPAAGINDAYLNIASLKYKVIRNDAQNTIVAQDLTTTSFLDDVSSLTEQQQLSYTIVASTSAGEGESANTNSLVFGPSLKIPFAESFADGYFQNKEWTFDIITGKGSAWYLQWYNEMSQDGDAGYLAYQFSNYLNNGSGICRVVTPMLDFNSVKQTRLSFWFFHSSIGGHEGANINIEISVNDGEFTTLPSGNIQLERENTRGWTYYEYSLAAYQGENNVRIGWKGSADYPEGDIIYIDNIRIVEMFDKDLKVESVDAPRTFITGVANRYQTVVKNYGIQQVEGNAYNVKLYNGNTLLEEKEGVDIAADEVLSFTFDYVADATTADVNMEIYSVVEFEADDNPSNNTSETIIIPVAKSYFENPKDLDSEEMNNKVTLIWTAPENPQNPIVVVDDFESYENFISENIGDWTTVDVDGFPTYAYTRLTNVEWENKGAPMAYQVMNDIDAKLASLGYFSPHSKRKALIVNFSIGGINDDWLISPELCGKEQMISFFVKSTDPGNNPERYIIYCSATDQAFESFVKVSEGEYVEVPNSIWQKVEYRLPEGAKYFAIRCISNDASGLMIDDISFVKAGESTTVNGYNIYRNNIKINESLVSSPSFVDNNPVSGINEYKVTAVYTDGESYFSNATTINLGGSSINQLEKTYNVYAGKGLIIVKGAENMPITVVSIGGLVLRQESGLSENHIAINKGIYLVKVGSKVFKVSVK